MISRSNQLEISNIKPSKVALEDIVSNIINPVIEGFDSAVEVATSLDFIIKVCEQAKATIKPEILSELSKAPERKEYNGYKVEASEAGVRYDFSNCNDPVLHDLLDQKEKLDGSIKDRETFLKSIKTHETIVDSDTGNVVTIYPPVKKSSTVPKFTLK
jgi:uncharacterized protein YdcH (DUF465 family)